MLLGYMVANLATNEQTREESSADPFRGIFASVAKREAENLGIDVPIDDINKATLFTNIELIKNQLREKQISECSILFELCLALSLTTMQRNELSEEMKAQILLLAELYNISEQVTAILELQNKDREKKIIELIKYVDTHPRMISDKSTSSCIPM